jgi:DNA-nicking Smr family endonuclease
MSSKKSAPGTFSFQPFENLKAIIDSRKITVPVKPAAEKKREDPSDDELFKDAMKEVNEIQEFRQLPVRPKKISPRLGNNAVCPDALHILKEVTRGSVPINLPDTQEYVEWVNPAYWPSNNCNLTAKLHKGFFSVQDCLDLHGLFADEAEEATESFLKDALVKGLRCVKIIHGRGLRSPDGPVLKRALLTWLTYRHRKNVMAFVSARQCDGGLGAVYVLLKP